MPRKRYPIIIHKDADSGFGCYAPDFPIIGLGETVERCVESAEDVLAACLADMAREARPLPEPTPVSEIDEVHKDGFVAIAFAATDLPDAKGDVSITLEQELLDAIDAVASDRSAFLTAAARARLG